MLEDMETINKIVLEVENMAIRERREYLKQYTKEEAKIIYKYIGKLKTKPILPILPIKPIEDIKPIKPLFKYEDWRESEIKECEPLTHTPPLLHPLTYDNNNSCSRTIYIGEYERVCVCLCEPDALPRDLICMDSKDKIYINDLLKGGVNIKNSKYIINIEDDIIKIAYIDSNKVSTIAI
jgi:hypothetical protein